MLKKETVEYIVAILENTGGTVSRATPLLIVDMFKGYDDEIVKQASRQAMSTCKFKMTLAHIKEELDLLTPPDPGEHLDAEEAYGLFPKSEYDTGVITQEIAEAYGDGVPFPVFKKRYDRLIAQAKAQGKKAEYYVTIGFDKRAAVHPVVQAIEKGRITAYQGMNAAYEHEELLLKAEQKYIASLPPAKRLALEGGQS
jgi:hypothetical protein